MPHDPFAVPSFRPAVFAPRALRVSPEERRMAEAAIERVLALHPAWPWPLIEAAARRLELAARDIELLVK